MVLNDENTRREIRRLLAEIAESQSSPHGPWVLWNPGHAVDATESLTEHYRLVHHHLKRFMDARNFFVALFERERNRIVCPYFVDQYHDELVIPNASESQSPTAEVIRTRSALLLDEEALRTIYSSGRSSPRGMESRAWLGAPFTAGGETIGAVVVHSYESSESYTREQIGLVESAARKIGAAINRYHSGLEIRNNRERMNQILDAVHAGIVLVDPETFTILDANRMAGSLIGQPRQKFLGGKCWDFICSEKKGYCPAAERGWCIESLECSFGPPGEKGIAVLKTVNQLIINGRRQLVETVIDISRFRAVQRENKQKDIRLYQRRKTEALKVMADCIVHDFTKIFSTIHESATMACRLAEADGEMHRHLRQIVKAGERGGNILNQMSIFSLDVVQDRRPMEIVPIVKGCLDVFRNSLPNTIELRQKLSNAPLIVSAVPELVCQMVMSLLANATQAMVAGRGVIDVELTRVQLDEKTSPHYAGRGPGRYLNLIVSDNGCGMDQPMLERIFDPFFTTRNRREGTGMGLAAVYGIIKSHEGDVKVFSKPGVGSTFQVLLPLVVHESPDRPGFISEIPKGNERILLVDDEPSMVQILLEMLSSLDYRVTFFTKPIEAWEAFQDDPEAFDLLLTDITMPQLNGIELAEKVRGLCPDVPVLIVTGLSQDLWESKLRGLDIEYVLMKPFSLFELGRIVREALDRPFGRAPGLH